MKIFPPHAIDFYKSGHIRQYPEGTQYVYSNFTPRSGKLAKMSPDWDGKVVWVGLQGVCKWMLIDLWRDQFFSKPKDEVVGRFKRRMDMALGAGSVDEKAIAELHDFGSLPIRIKALPEGVRVNMKVPLFTVINTDPRFFWLTNYLESQISAECWKVITAATIAYEFRRLLSKYAKLTGSPEGFVQWQGHDFSFRGMGGIYDGGQSSIGHLLSFSGTDTVLGLDYIDDYYNGNGGWFGGSVPATEHSVMCMGGPDDEIGTFRRLITEVYPSGVVSIVSDTWNYWDVLTDYAVNLKPEIMGRTPDANGLSKVVFRPDTGEPELILCGDPEARAGTPENAGTFELLWDGFGGTRTETGHRALDSHVGAIYGDSITLERATGILENMYKNGFATSNVVFGVGSFTYQYVTRDTLGMAYKCTWGVVNGEARELFKDPVTGDGVKKSAKGLLRVEKEGADYVLYDQQTEEQEQQGALELVFQNGKLYRDESFATLRNRLHGDSF